VACVVTDNDSYVFVWKIQSKQFTPINSQTLKGLNMIISVDLCAAFDYKLYLRVFCGTSALQNVTITVLYLI